jgi:hypothetical protein
VRFSVFTFLAVRYGSRIAAGFGAHVRLIVFGAGVLVIVVLIWRAIRRRGRSLQPVE